MTQQIPTILNTPLSIYRIVTTTVACPEIDMELRNQRIVLHIRFSPQFPLLSLTNAVDGRAFQEVVKHVKTYVDTLRLFRGGMQPILDASKFSIPEPLSNWQEYRRFMHQNRGRNCTDALMAFLQNPVAADEISQLGLAPNQVDGQTTPHDLVYFREILGRLRPMDQAQKQAIMDNIERHYPNILRQLLNEVVAQERLAQAQERDNFYQNTLTILKQQVIGQDQAVEKMAAILATQRNLDSNKVFLCVGPSGVGKTELAKAVSRTRENRFILLQMQTCQEEHHVSKIFGSPPGYVGSQDKPHFAQEIDKWRPTLVSIEGTTKNYHISNLVVLFDEFEKAHSRIKQSLLTLFDEGLYVAQFIENDRNVTCRYELKKCIIVNTSNLYKDEVLRASSSGQSSDQIVELFKQLNRDSPTRESLSAELLGRMSVIPFGPIPRGEAYQRIARLKLNDFCNELRQEFGCRLVDVETENLVLSALETKLYGDGTDIRRFRRYFDEIKPILYQSHQNWGPMANKKLTFCCIEEALYLKVSIYLEEFLRYHFLGVAPLRLP